MVTSEMSCAFHYELYSTRTRNTVLHDFSSLNIDNEGDRPVLYVAVATWIPKCNMYTYNEYVLKAEKLKRVCSIITKNLHLISFYSLKK